MATEKLSAPVGIEQQAAQLLQLLGGTKTTTSPGDTSALQSTLGQLQGTDYEAMLKAIFQQAGGQIPGIQQALGNAIGARSGGNSAVQAALQKLLAQTSTGAMDQVAKLQAQNFATQANVGANIANATKGTTQRTGTDVSKGLSEGAKLIALLQGAKSLGVDKWFKALTSATPETVTPATATPAAVTSQTGALTSAPVDYSLAGAGAVSPFSISDQFTGGDYTLPDTSLSSSGLQSPGGQQSPYDYQLGSFDYGLTTGADTSQGLDYTPSYQVDDYVDPADWTADYSLFADGGLVKKSEGYADGGTVRAGGSRRSANPTVDIRSPDTMLATAAADELRGAQGQALSSPVATAAGSDIANMFSSAGQLSGYSGDGGGDNSPGMNEGNNPSGISGRDVAGALGKVGAANAISGLTGGPTLGAAAGGLGLLGGLSAAQTPGQALGAAAKGALGIASPALSSLAGFATNPTQVNALNIATAFNPTLALANAALGLAGTSLGTQALGTPQSVDPVTGDVTEATMGMLGGLFGGGGVVGGNPAMSSPVSGWGDVTTTDLGLLGDSGFGSGGDGGGGGFGSSDAAGSANAGDASGVGGDSPGSSYAANGGPITGPGTGTSDDIGIKVSDGEFVISADVVDTLGEDFFNQLQAAFHTPVAQQRRA